jgi:anti-sigma-K factor RskA
MNCTQVEDLAPFYVAGALSANEAALVQSHLAGCKLHEASLAALAVAAAVNPSAIEPMKTPPALKTRLMTAVREDAAPSPTYRRLSIPKPALAGAFAVALLVIAGLLAWNLQLRGDTNHNEAFAAALQGPNGGSGVFYYNELLEGVIYVEGLTPPPAGQTYQVWAMTKDGPHNCGLLSVTSAAPAFARMKGDVAPGDRVFVTLEPSGGSAAPLGPRVLTQ